MKKLALLLVFLFPALASAQLCTVSDTLYYGNGNRAARQTITSAIYYPDTKLVSTRTVTDTSNASGFITLRLFRKGYYKLTGEVLGMKSGVIIRVPDSAAASLYTVSLSSAVPPGFAVVVGQPSAVDQDARDSARKANDSIRFVGSAFWHSSGGGTGVDQIARDSAADARQRALNAQTTAQHAADSAAQADLDALQAQRDAGVALDTGTAQASVNRQQADSLFRLINRVNFALSYLAGQIVWRDSDHYVANFPNTTLDNWGYQDIFGDKWIALGYASWEQLFDERFCFAYDLPSLSRRVDSINAFKQTKYGTVVRTLTSDAINAAIQAAPGGTEIHLIDGNYQVTTPIIIDRPIKLVGNGMMRTVLYLANGANCPVVILQGSTAGDRNFFPTLRDLQIHGNSSHQTVDTCHGVLTRKNPTSGAIITDLVMDGCFVQYTRGACIKFDVVHYQHVTNCWLEYPATDAIHIVNPAVAPPPDPASPPDYEGARSVVVDNTEIVAANNLHFTDSLGRYTDGSGIYIDNGGRDLRATFRNVEVRAAHKHAIHLKNVNRVTLMDLNLVDAEALLSPDDAAIQIDSCRNILVMGVEISNRNKPQTNGIVLTGTTDSVQLIGNNLANFTMALAGKSTIASGNYTKDSSTSYQIFSGDGMTVNGSRVVTTADSGVTYATPFWMRTNFVSVLDSILFVSKNRIDVVYGTKMWRGQMIVGTGDQSDGVIYYAPLKISAPTTSGITVYNKSDSSEVLLRAQGNSSLIGTMSPHDFAITSNYFAHYATLTSAGLFRTSGEITSPTISGIRDSLRRLIDSLTAGNLVRSGALASGLATRQPLMSAGTLGQVWKMGPGGVQGWYPDSTAGAGAVSMDSVLTNQARSISSSGRMWVADDSIVTFRALNGDSINAQLGQMWYGTLTASDTLFIGGMANGQQITVVIAQAAAGGKTLLWTGNANNAVADPPITWLPEGSAAPVMPTTANRRMKFKFEKLNGTIYGTAI